MYHQDTTRPQNSQDHLAQAAEKRRYALQTAAMLEATSTDATYHRVLECGLIAAILEDDTGSARRYDTGFACGHRMCPACAWRKSMGTAVLITAISGKLTADGRTPLLVTLTAPNCTGADLSDTIKRYNRAWDKLLNRKRYKQSWSDNIRKLEVTYNQVADTYHPHLHVIVYVRPSYFDGKHYISRAQLLTDWREVYGDPSITQVDVRKSYGTDGRAIAELAKYAAKASDYLISQQVFDCYNSALRHKRIYGYSGLCKQLRAEYRAGGLREYVDRDTSNYAWRVIYRDLGMGDYAEEWRMPYDASISADLDIASSWAYLDD